MKDYRFKFLNTKYYIQYLPGDVLLFWATEKSGQEHLVGYYKDKKFSQWRCAIYLHQTVIKRLLKMI